MTLNIHNGQVAKKKLKKNPKPYIENHKAKYQNKYKDTCLLFTCLLEPWNRILSLVISNCENTRNVNKLLVNKINQIFFRIVVLVFQEFDSLERQQSPH